MLQQQASSRRRSFVFFSLLVGLVVIAFTFRMMGPSNRGGVVVVVVKRTTNVHDRTGTVVDVEDDQNNNNNADDDDDDVADDDDDDKDEDDDDDDENDETTSFRGIAPRAFPVWDKPLPCFPPDNNLASPRRQRTPAYYGFLFNKLMKVGGSTAAGMNVRIATQLAKRQKMPFKWCQGRWDHSTALHQDYGRRDREKSFLWTVVREPTRRAVSQFFHFQVSKRNVPATAEAMEDHLSTDRVFPYYYLKTLGTHDDDAYPDVKRHPVQTANRILDEYDYVGITERMEDTAVVLSMLVNVSLADVVYLDAKTSGGYDAMCNYIQPTVLTEDMQRYLQSPEWKQIVEWDTVLYQAANRSLDLTIDQLGRAKFARKLAEFRRLRSAIQKECGGLEVFPCTRDGKENDEPDCLWNDSGCGNTCINKLLKRTGMQR